MRIEIMAVSPSYGGGGLALVGDFLLEGLPDVGAAIEVVEVELLLRSRPRAQREVHDEPAPLDLGSLPEAIRQAIEEANAQAIGPDHPEWDRDHEDRRSKGPALTFRRASRRVALRLVSGLSEYDVFGRDDDLTPELFSAAAREIVVGLAGIRRRIKGADEFDAAGFLGHLESRLAVLPTTRDELDRILAPLAEAAARRRAALGPWEALDVDWALFAPGTRERFDDPFFFDPADEEAPHGNDTGADLLADYLKSRPDDGMAFLQRCAQDMGFETMDELSASESREHDALVIAFVFAELMVRGTTSDDFVHLALQALTRRDVEAPSPRNQLLRRALL